MSKRGFTMIELMVGIVLVGILGTAIYRLLVNTQQVYTMQTQRADLNANTRTVVALLPSELRELAATDALESDVREMTATAVSFKAMRGLSFACQPPVGTGSTGTLILWRSPRYGLRPALDADRDSLLIFREGNGSTRTDDSWVHANVSAAPVIGTGCPGGAASVTVALTNVRPVNSLAGVRTSAPVRSYEMMRLSTYADVASNRWLGAQRFSKSGGGYETVQPLLGPLAASGLTLTYLDSAGAVTTNPARVHQIGLTVIGMTMSPVRVGTSFQRAVDTLITSVALRNNAR